MTVKSKMRYAHVEGLMDICADSVTKKIFTCGIDGDVRVWENCEDDDPETFSVGNEATAICVFDQKLFVADETSTIQSFILPNCEKDGFVTKFTLPVTHMVANLEGSHILAASRDFGIKFVSISDNSQKTFGESDGHTAPVLSVALDPKSEFAATSGADGHVKIWRLDEPWKPIKTLRLFKGFNDSTSNHTTLCRLQFRPKNGQSLAIPVDREIQLYERHTWTLSKTLKNDEILDTISVCCFSACGEYLACGCLNGQLMIFDVEDERTIFSDRHPKNEPICGVLWHPIFTDRLLYCDTNGQVGVIKGIVSNKSEQVKASSNKAQSSVPVDDDESMDSDIGAIKSRYNTQIFIDDDDDDREIQEVDAKPVTVNHTVTATVQPSAPSWKPKPVQEPFVVASTPKHLSQRYMKWNPIGVVFQYETEEESSIDVEFHDSATHHDLHIDNSIAKYSMADLSVEALALASDLDENTKKSILYVMHFGAWDSSREWSTDLPEGHEACCLCLGRGWVAVGSRKNTIWLFTIAGCQLRTISTCGSLVTLVGHDDSLLVAYIDGMRSDGSSSITCASYSKPHRFASTTNKPDYFSLVLSENSSLVWLGFSYEGCQSCSFDSKGVLRLLDNGSWMEIFDGKQEVKNEDDFVWVTSVHEHPAKIRGIVCKRAKYPSILPRPVLCSFDWRLLFCGNKDEKASNEEKLFLANLHKRKLANNEDEEQLDALCKVEFESMARLFLLACNAERDCRAFEIAQLAEVTKYLEALINLAVRKGRRVLAEKIADLARRREENVQQQRCSGTQELFPDADVDDDRDNYVRGVQHDDDNENERGKTQIGKNPLLESPPKRNLNILTEGPSRNPFKKRYANGTSESKSSGESVFDRIEQKKRNSVEVPFTFDSVSKKPKMLSLKKQTKLAFSSNLKQSATTKTKLALDMFAKENKNSLTQCFDGELSKFDEFVEKTFESLPDAEKQIYQNKASVLEQLEEKERNVCASPL